MSVIMAGQPHGLADAPSYVSAKTLWVEGRGARGAGAMRALSIHPSRAWEEQFAEVVHPRIPRLQRLARRILRSDDLADDAVQEALVSFWKEGRLPRNPEGWLLRAVVLRSLHLNRARRRRRNYEERAGAERVEHDLGGDGARALEAQEAVQTATAVLRKLPEHLRTVFVLREAEQRDYASIAVALGVPVGTVRSRLNRSRKAVRAILDQLQPALNPRLRGAPALE
jgi:RNA polymerase sigma-70 factor (ECF subfamily)